MVPDHQIRTRIDGRMGERPLIGRKFRRGVHDAFMQRNDAQLRTGPPCSARCHRPSAAPRRGPGCAEPPPVVIAPPSCGHDPHIGAAGCMRLRPACLRTDAVVAQHGDAHCTGFEPRRAGAPAAGSAPAPQCRIPRRSSSAMVSRCLRVHSRPCDCRRASRRRSPRPARAARCAGSAPGCRHVGRHFAPAAGMGYLQVPDGELCRPQTRGDAAEPMRWIGLIQHQIAAEHETVHRHGVVPRAGRAMPARSAVLSTRDHGALGTRIARALAVVGAHHGQLHPMAGAHAVGGRQQVKMQRRPARPAAVVRVLGVGAVPGSARHGKRGGRFGAQRGLQATLGDDVVWPSGLTSSRYANTFASWRSTLTRQARRRDCRSR